MDAAKSTSSNRTPSRRSNNFKLSFRSAMLALSVLAMMILPAFVQQKSFASDEFFSSDISAVGSDTTLNEAGGLTGSSFIFTRNETIWDYLQNPVAVRSLPAFSEFKAEKPKSKNAPSNQFIRVTTDVLRWISPSNPESPTPVIIGVEVSSVQFPDNGDKKLTSGSVNVTLPPHIEFDRNFGDLAGIVSVTGSGQNVLIRMSHSSGLQGWGARFYGKIKPLNELPITAPTGEVRFSGSTSGSTGSFGIGDVKPTSMFYTKPRWTRLSEGPVFPGDEVEFKVETQNYPHAPSRYAELKIHAPEYTEFVPGSFTGLDGAIVTDSTTSYGNKSYTSKKLEWGAVGTDHTVTYRLRIKPDVPVSVTKIGFPDNVLVPEYEWSIPPALGRYEKVPQNYTLDVEHQDVGLAIILPEKPLAKGDVFAATVKVTSYRNDRRTITFNDPLLKERPFSGVADDAILTLDVPPLPPPFELTPVNPTRSFSVPVKVNKLGVTELVSSLSFTGPGGVAGSLTKVKKVTVPPLRLTLEVTPENTVLNQTEDASKTAECVAHEISNSSIANCIEITAKIKNDSEKTVKNIRISDPENPLAFIASLDFESPGVPLKAIDYHAPRSGEIDLAPGEEAIWTWHLNAFDAPAKLELSPVFSGTFNGGEVRVAAVKNFKILENVLLKWGMRPTDGRTSYISGQNVRADGYIENVSAKDGGEKKFLRVLVYQIPKKNVGGGFVFPSTYSGPNPTQYQVFDLPAEGNAKRLDVKSVFRSFKIDFSALGTDAASGDIEYGVSLWVVEADGKLTPATDQALLDDDYTDDFSVSFSPEQIIADQYVQDCLNAGFMPILCSFNQALAGEAVDGVFGLVEFSLYSLEQTGEGTVRTGAYSLWAMRELMKATLGNPQAKQALMQDLYVQYLTFHQLGVLSGQVAGQAPLVFEAFSIQAGEGIGRYMNAIERGDLNELQVQTGHFLGANPDLLFEPLVVGRSFTNMAKSLTRAGNGISENVFTAAARAEGVQRAATVESRVAEAIARGEDPATALVGGDVLKPSLMIRVFGVADAQVQRLMDFARENEVILAFRSRHPLSQTLLDENKAYPKPQAFKQKTVNSIDIDFLGYRREAEATIEIVEPPVGIAGKKDAELTKAIDAYMDVLTAKNPVLSQNRVLRDEVRERLEGRAKEWNEYKPQLMLNNLNEPVRVGVNFGAGDQFVRDVSGDVGVKEFRKVERNRVGDFLDPVTGTNRRRWEIKMEGPGGAPARNITGDIDFLGILDKHGRMIRDDNKRIALYTQMQEFMEHGESMSYRYENLRQKFVRCCIEGGEAMMTVGPWQGDPRAAHFVDNLSVMEEFNADFKRVRGTEPALGPAGEIRLDAEGKPVEVTLRHEDPTGEFSLFNGVPLLNNPNKAFVTRFAPLIFETIFNEFKERIPYYFPSILARILGGDDDLHRTGNRSANAAAASAIFRRGAPVLQAAGVSEIDLVEPNALRRWTAETGWRPISREEAIAAGDPNLADIAPNSSLSDRFAAGTKNLTITPASELAFEGDFFSADDLIVINPGGSNQETAIIESVEPIVLKNELLYEHNPGEMAAVITPKALTTPTPTPTLTPTPTPTPTLTPTPTPTPTLTPTPTPTPSPTPTPTPTPVPSGAFTVDNTTDNSALSACADAVADDCSLRGAISRANTTAGANTITFDTTVFNTPQTIIVTGTELTINATDSMPLTITGPGANLLTVSGNNAVRVFRIVSSNAPSISDLTLTQGFASDGGGAIYTTGGLALTNAVVTGNKAAERGGGISHFGNLPVSIINSIISNNMADSDNTGGQLGGGISSVNSATLTVTNSTISNNSVGGTSGQGGGIYYTFGSPANITGSTISGNSLTGGGGGVSGSNINISNSTINGNMALGSQGDGGGIFVAGLSVTNSTVSGNTAGRNVGGIFVLGGNVFTLTSSTVVNNTAVVRQGGVAAGSSTNNIGNTIIANNTDDGTAPDISGTINSQGYNLIENTTGAIITGMTTGNITGVDPRIDGVLRNNGGLTATHALRRSSPALDAGDPTAAAATDQRGLTRPVDGNGDGTARADIGAYERQANDIIVPAPFDFEADGRADFSVFRPSANPDGNFWYSRSSSTDSFSAFEWGLQTDRLAPADYDGDERTDVAVWRQGVDQEKAYFFIVNSKTGAARIEQFGNTGDRLTVGDWDGDGSADLSVYRDSAIGSQSYFYYRPSAQPNVNFISIPWGAAGDRPVRGDFDGDGKQDAAIYRPSSGTWIISQSSNAQPRYQQFGVSTDKAVPADYDGDGKADIAVWRGGTFFIIQSSNAQTAFRQFGAAGDIAVPAAFVQ